jgi:uncharacterized protein YqjF (DUF2071 family)
MDGIRFPFLPPVPIMSRLWELNIRTYVTVNGIKGVYFITLETDSKLGELIARNFFHLPYRYSQINAIVGNEHYQFTHNRKPFHFDMKASIHKETKDAFFDKWATERYALFTKKGLKTYQGTVMHEPWELKRLKITSINNKFTNMLTSAKLDFIDSAYSKSIKVQFKNFKLIS